MIFFPNQFETFLKHFHRLQLFHICYFQPNIVFKKKDNLFWTQYSAEELIFYSRLGVTQSALHPWVLQKVKRGKIADPVLSFSLIGDRWLWRLRSLSIFQNWVFSMLVPSLSLTHLCCRCPSKISFTLWNNSPCFKNVQLHNLLEWCSDFFLNVMWHRSGWNLREKNLS